MTDQLDQSKDTKGQDYDQELKQYGKEVEQINDDQLHVTNTYIYYLIFLYFIWIYSVNDVFKVLIIRCDKMVSHVLPPHA